MFEQGAFLQELKDIRIAKGISSSEMARQIGSSRSQVHFIEKGNPSLSTISKYLEVIGLDLNDIFKE